MIKPQFELEPSEINKGVVREERLRQKSINKIKQVALNLGLKIISEVDSGLKGPKGNLERFVLLRKSNYFDIVFLYGDLFAFLIFCYRALT